MGNIWRRQQRKLAKSACSEAGRALRLSAGVGLALVFALVGWGVSAKGQSLPPMTRSTSAVFVMGGMQNSQLPYYADNSLGVDFGAFVQPQRFLGGEVRAGTYPVSTRFSQSSITAGARIGGVLGNRRWEPYGYFGVGGARAQDEGAKGSVMAAEWDPTVQAAIGLDLNSERFSLRLADISLRETYTPLRSIRTVGVSVGLVYRFQMGGIQLR